MADATGRNIVLNDGGNKTICKNITLYAYQDTYVSNNQNGRFYFEDGVIRGRTDYICGKGDVYFNNVNFKNCDKGGYIAVPSQPKKYGYILNNCTISGENDDIDGNYTLGRPWGAGTPIALWINTRMEIIPSAIGWNEMSGGYPARFAEFNSQTATGTVINLSNRKIIFANTHTNNPILKAEEAAKYTIENIMGQDDDWDPTSATEQAATPSNVKITGNTITWDDNNYVLLWAIVKNDKITDFTTTATYDITDTQASYAIRAANEMGGLGEAVKVDTSTEIKDISTTNVAKVKYYSPNGTCNTQPQKGMNIIMQTYSDGRTKSNKIMLK
jgi:Pectin methylesterase